MLLEVREDPPRNQYKFNWAIPEAWSSLQNLIYETRNNCPVVRKQDTVQATAEYQIAAIFFSNTTPKNSKKFFPHTHQQRDKDQLLPTPYVQEELFKRAQNSLFTAQELQTFPTYRMLAKCKMRATYTAHSVKVRPTEDSSGGMKEQNPEEPRSQRVVTNSRA